MTRPSANRSGFSLSLGGRSVADRLTSGSRPQAGPGERPPLRLRAVDGEDLSIISAQVQDAIVPVGDMAYLADEQVFAMVVNRFMWECGPIDPHGAQEVGRDGPMCPLYLRTNCGMEFRQVTNVRSRGIDLRDRGQMLCLLALSLEPDAIDLHFSGGGAIRLSVTGVDCRVRDIDEPWPTELRPSHALDDDHAEAGPPADADRARA